MYLLWRRSVYETQRNQFYETMNVITFISRRDTHFLRNNKAKQLHFTAIPWTFPVAYLNIFL